MIGKELLEKLEKIGNETWEENVHVYVSVNGVAKELTDVKALFPKLSNMNEIVLTDGVDVLQDNEFWEHYYGSYMDIISEEDADAAVKAGNPCFYILYCDGTEGQIDANISAEDWENIKSWGVMYGYEK